MRPAERHCAEDNGRSAARLILEVRRGAFAFGEKPRTEKRRQWMPSGTRGAGDHRGSTPRPVESIKTTPYKVARRSRAVGTAGEPPQIVDGRNLRSPAPAEDCTCWAPLLYDRGRGSRPCPLWIGLMHPQDHCRRNELSDSDRRAIVMRPLHGRFRRSVLNKAARLSFCLVSSRRLFRRMC
jgi:hypothetical protein